MKDIEIIKTVHSTSTAVTNWDKRQGYDSPRPYKTIESSDINPRSEKSGVSPVLTALLLLCQITIIVLVIIGWFTGFIGSFFLPELMSIPKVWGVIGMVVYMILTIWVDILFSHRGR